MYVKYSDMVRFFTLDKKINEISRDIADLQASIRTTSFITVSHNPKTVTNSTERKALRITDLQEKHEQIYQEWSDLYTRLCDTALQMDDNETGYVMWCIFTTGGNMHRACKLACKSRKKVDEIFRSYIEKSKEVDDV